MAEPRLTSRPRRRALLTWAPLPIVLVGLALVWALQARGGGWLAGALRDPVLIRQGVLVAGCAITLQVVLVAMWRLGTRRRQGLLRDQSGSAMLEFALLFPVAMAIILLMVQVSLMMVGRVFVHYAAFAATRAATVYVPASELSEPRNEVAPPGSSTKLEAIRRAAVMAVLPVAGKGMTETPADALRAGYARLYGDYGLDLPGWVGTSLGRKLYYADANTNVELAPPQNGRAYEEREDITVTVHHRLYLALPYIGRILGDGSEDGQYYSDVYATYTLVNQGRDDRVFIELNEDQTSPGYGKPLMPQ